MMTSSVNNVLGASGATSFQISSSLGTVSPIIAGVLVDEFGLKSAFVYSGIVVLVSTILLALLKLPKTINQQEAPH